MDFKDTFSKIRKTAMDTASTVAQSAKEGSVALAKKSGELIEVSKLTLSINSEEAKIKELYSEIGEKVFEKHASGHYIDPELVENCNEITAVNNKIKELKDKIEDIKANSKIDSVEFEEVSSEDIESDDVKNNTQQ